MLRSRISGAAAPKAAVAPADELQALLVARECGVFLQLELLLRGIPALPCLAERLHRGRRILQDLELLLGVLLGAEPAAGVRMAGDQPIPVHRQDLLDRVLGLERIEVDHAASWHPVDRKQVDYEYDLIFRQ